MSETNRIKEILDLCIERIRNGESVEDVLASYPDDREQLEPLLQLAESLQEVPRLEPRDSAFCRSLFATGVAFASMKPKRGRAERFRSTLAWAASFLVVAMLGIYTTVAFAKASQPGDLLYPIKLAAEKVSLIVVRDPEGRAELRIALSENRLREIVASAGEGQVNKTVLLAMLEEAHRALDNIEEIPEIRREILVAKVGYLSGFQQNALKALVPSVPASEASILNTAIETCDQRWQWCCGKKQNNGGDCSSPQRSREEWRMMCPNKGSCN